MHGLRRIQIVFVDLAPVQPSRSPTGDFSAVVRDGTPLDLKRDAQRSGASSEFSERQECQAIGAAVAEGGLEVVARCPPDDLECGTLFLTMETSSTEGDDMRLYVVAIELSQRVHLARDPAGDLSMPTTWSVHRFGRVSRQALNKVACQQLHDLAVWFNALWQAANR